MKIAVINGSPKGKYSITLQTVRYPERKFPDIQFDILHAGQLNTLDLPVGIATYLYFISTPAHP